MNIHPTAIVSNKARLSQDIEIGPYAIIEDDVQIGRAVKVYAQAQILNQTTIGDSCQIHMGAVLGHQPQIRNLVADCGRLEIGERNIFREYVTVHRSSQKNGTTVIGNDNYLMGFAHIAHDCSIGNQVTICNGALIAGHVVIEDCAFISGNVTVHQFCRIGKFAMVGGLARVAKDVPPYMLVKGDSAIWAVNSVGLKRAGLSLSSRSQIKAAFKLIYKSGLNVAQAIAELRKLKRSAEVTHLINFILNSRRGICAYKRFAGWPTVGLTALFTRAKQFPSYRLFQARQQKIGQPKCPER